MDLDFKKIDFGPDDAKEDYGLLKYFVEVPGYTALEEGKKRYIVGMKGSGKTAIIEYLRLKAQGNPLIFTTNVSLRSFPLNYLRNLRDKSMKDKSQYVPIWMHLILVEVCQMIVQDNGAITNNSMQEIKDFLLQNYGGEYTGITESVTQLKENSAKITVGGKFLGKNKTDKFAQQETVQVHYQKSTNKLIELLCNIETSSTFYIFFDELDEGYKAGDSSQRLLLLALIRAVEDIALSLKKGITKIFPILVLRSDIFDRLEDNDLNKIDEYVLRLRWRQDFKSAFSLRTIVNKRITSSLNTGEGDPWKAVCKENDPNIPFKQKSLFRAISNLSLERPRDVLKYLKLSQEMMNTKVLDYKCLHAAEQSYSAWFYREIRDVLQSHLSVWKEALECISRVGDRTIKPDKLILELNNHKAISVWMENNNKSAEDIISILFDFSIIGTLSKRRVWTFAYRDSDVTWNPADNIIVHLGLHQKLRLFRDDCGIVKKNTKALGTITKISKDGLASTIKTPSTRYEIGMRNFDLNSSKD